MRLEDIVLRGTRALQPLATAVPIGTQYHVTDESVTERSNGTTWQSYSGAAASGITQLTGAVTAGPGSGSQTATIANDAVTTAKIINDAVTYAKIQNVTDARLLGRSAGLAGDAQEITVGSGLTLAAGALTAPGGASDWGTTVVKSGDQTVSDNVFVDDTELQLAVIAAEAWFIEFLILYSGTSATADYRSQLIVSAGNMTGFVTQQGISSADAGVTTTVAMIAATSVLPGTVGTDAVSGIRTLIQRAFIRFSANGTFKYQFAQSTLTGSNSVKTYLGSILRAKKII